MITTSCNKKTYPTHEDAARVLKKARRRRRPGPQDPVRFYRCPECQQYHLSSSREGKP